MTVNIYANNNDNDNGDNNDNEIYKLSTPTNFYTYQNKVIYRNLYQNIVTHALKI